MPISRRQFIQRVAQAGGYRAAWSALGTLGLVSVSSTAAATPELGAVGKRHGKVIILGAGVAGLAAAYELEKAGYSCIVLEARDRVGGRNWTVRNGSKIEMNDGSSQTCTFDEGLYFNAGPARLPSNHRTVLGYCKALGVPLEVEVNMSRSALLQSDAANGGQPIEMRQAINDMRGQVAELLAKCVDRKALDAELTGIDHERFAEFLREYGDLGKDFKFAGSSRSGYLTEPGAGLEAGTARPPLALKTLLDPVFWNGPLFDETYEMQPTMFQPVGGMDRIPAAFAKHLKTPVRLGAEVLDIRNGENEVRVAYRDRKTGKTTTIKGDYCICTIPPPVLKSIPNNFSEPFNAAIAAVVYGHANKIAWQTPRFWETERHIYGGLTFTQRDVQLIWYPSGGYFQPEGVLIGCYNFEEVAEKFMQQPIPARLQASRDAIEAMFPGHAASLKRGVTVAWNRIPYNLGPWTNWDEPNTEPYRRLIEPEGRTYLAGEHLSHITGWQEGSLLSTHRVLKQIAERDLARAAT